VAGSNLPTTRRFKFEDYKDAPQWFANFLQSLNLFIDPVYQILDGGVAYSNQIAPRFYTKTITTPASGAVTFNFSNPLSIIPSAVILGNVYKTSNTSTHPSSSSCVYWHFSQGIVYVDDIPNLDAATQYIVTLQIQ
jgi:hypothetical protein